MIGARVGQQQELYACVCVREFPAQSLLRRHPGLKGMPLVVMEGEAPNQQVCSLNVRAGSLGLCRGMTGVEAELFSGYVALPRCSEAEAAAQATVLECVGAFSPRVESVVRTTEFLCVVDIAGTRGLFGSPEMLVKEMLSRLHALGMYARVAVSTNFYTALCVANALRGILFQLIGAGGEADALSRLSLCAAELTAQQQETFALWGVQTLGQMAALPQRDLISRFGPEGERLHQLARGTLRHVFQPSAPPLVLEEQIELEAPVELLDSLLFVLHGALEQLILRANARCVALATVHVSLVLGSGQPHARMVRPAFPSNDKKLWLKLLQLELEANSPAGAVVALRLHAEPGPTSKVQLGLFSPQLPETGRLDLTLARIRAIVGEGNVGKIVLQDTHGQDGFALEKFESTASGGAVEQALYSRCAMRLLRPPEDVAVAVHQERPAELYLRGQRCVVEHASGPWMASGNWWEETRWGVEQWDVIGRWLDGTMLVGHVFYDRLRKSWQIAGIYD